MAVGLAIRELGLSDVDLVADVLDAVVPDWVDVLAPGASGPVAFVADRATFMFGAWADVDGVSRPVGMAWGAHVRYPTGRIMTYLHQLEVIESHRRQGIATMLTDASMALAHRLGHDRFWLSTGGHNDAAQALYRSMGGAAKPDGDVNFWWDLRGSDGRSQ